MKHKNGIRTLISQLEKYFKALALQEHSKKRSPLKSKNTTGLFYNLFILMVLTTILVTYFSNKSRRKKRPKDLYIAVKELSSTKISTRSKYGNKQKMSF